MQEDTTGKMNWGNIFIHNRSMSVHSGRIPLFSSIMERGKRMSSHSIVKFNIMTSLLTVVNRNDTRSTDYVIAEYLLRHLRDLGKLSIYKVADDCFVSRSSVQRFIKALGYDSFTEFKDGARELEVHKKAFIDYTDHPDYAAYLEEQLNHMARSISQAASQQKLTMLARKIHDSQTVVMMASESSAGPLNTFQESLAVFGKVIRILTSSSSSVQFLEDLGDKDLVINCSVSGNYALAINDDIQKIHCEKVLVTLNRTVLLANNYDCVFYLSSEVTPSVRNISASRNVYTRYSLTFFLDLLYHTYYSMYATELS